MYVIVGYIDVYEEYQQKNRANKCGCYIVYTWTFQEYGGVV